MNVRRRLPSGPRAAYTLVEILVVMAIIAGLAALTVLIIPKLQDSGNVAKGADIVQGKLFVAKQTALRNQQPCGIRFLSSAGSANGPFDQLEFIEQPAPYAVGLVTAVAQAIDPVTNGYIVTFGADSTGAAPDFSNGTVQVGDLLDLTGAGDTYSSSSSATPAMHMIVAVTPGANPTVSVLTVPLVFATATGAPPGQYRTPPPWPYRIVRAPRPLVGESLVTLPAGIIVDRPSPNGLGMANGGSLISADSFSGQFDILFDPSGKVLRSAGTQGKVVLWVCDNPQTSGNPGAPDQTLIAVYTRTGAITTQPANIAGTSATYYQFVQDGVTSGM